jgi:uncharacterized repeat protein (TIGR01451 family)
MLVCVGWMAVLASTSPLWLDSESAAAQADHDLRVTLAKAGALPGVPTGTNVAFVVTVSNVGAAQADAVLTRVTMPGGFTSVSAQPAPGSGITCNITGTVVGSPVGPAVLCTAPNIAGNSEKTFRISTTAPSTITGSSQSLTLTAVVDPNNTVQEGAGGNNNNSDNLAVNIVTMADLQISLLGAPGQDFTTQVAPDLAYVVTVKNTGDREATNLIVKSTLPKDVAFVRVEENTLGNCVQNSTASNGALNVNCTVASVPAGDNRHVRVIGKTVGSVPDGSKVTFSAFADPTNSVAERNDNDNSAAVITTLRARSELQMTGAVNYKTTGPLLEGDTPNTVDCLSRMSIAVTLAVKNNGPFRSPATIITATWPAQIGTANESCFDRCNVPALDPGQSVNLILSATVTANSAAGSVTAQLDPNQTVFDPIVSNNRFTKVVCG